jgi:pyruvate/2-oxoglutarate/acetoin dehydrogenase E1 component
MPRLRYLQALAKALRDEMTRDPSVFVIGEDVRQSVRGVTRGLADDFGPERVLDTPISEQAFTGFATGAALAGMRPVVEFQIPTLVYVAFEQMVNQAQKFHLMTGGQAVVPVTYFIPGSGARAGLGGQHSDHPYPLFIHMGVKTVLPATAEDAYGLMVSAIRDPDPVMVYGPNAVLGVRGELPEESYTIELGKGRIHREGSDVTVVAIGHLVHDALALAEEVADEFSIEIFDPRTLHPFDWELLGHSLSKTGRLVVYDDSNRSCGLAAEIVATAAEEMDLRQPPKRVTRADIPPVPFSTPLEQAVLPTRSRLQAAIADVLSAKVLQ